VRISAQLNDVATGSHIWAERFDRRLADVFAVQDEITEAIVGSIEPQLYAAENFRARRKLPDSMDAWELVIRREGDGLRSKSGNFDTVSNLPDRA
jgi:hypothetical protein